jgi:hypothetical protein
MQKLTIRNIFNFKPFNVAYFLYSYQNIFYSSECTFIMFMNQHTAFTGMLAAKSKAKEAQIFRGGCFPECDCILP